MAVEIEATGQLQEFLEILNKRKWQVILPAVFIVTLGSAFAVVVPKKYTVDTQVELRETMLEGTSERNSPMASQIREAQNAAFHIKAPNRVRAVIERLRWTDYLSMSPAERHGFVRNVQKAIEVTVPRGRAEGGSTFVTIEYRDVDPVRAVDFLVNLRDDWITNEVQRGRRAIEERGIALLQRRRELQEEFNAKQDELSQLQSAHGLSPTQPVPGGMAPRAEDPQILLWQRKVADREQVRDELSEVEAELAALRLQREKVEPQVLRKVTTGEVDHAERIADLEQTRDQLYFQLGGYKQGSTHRTLTRRIADLEAQIESIREQQRRGEVREEWVTNPVYATLSERILQGELLLARHQARLENLDDELARQQEALIERHEVYAIVRRDSDELDRLRLQLEDVVLLSERNRLDLDIVGGPAGNPFQIISPVAAPTAPSEPHPWLIVAFSLVAGLGVGLAIAVLAEYSKSCFRSAADISRVMVVPVLGVVNTIRTQAETRGERLRRLTVAASTVMLLGAVSFVTWAWAVKQDLLSPWLLEQIEEFRKLFV